MFRKVVIISTILISLAGTAVLAQVQGRAGRARGGRAAQLRGKAAGRDGRSAQNLQRLQQRLNLTDVQMNGVRALQENRQKETESVRQETLQKRQALRQLMQQPNPNPSEVGNATLELKESQERMRQINQRFMTGVRGLLTPDQQQNLPKRLR